MITKYINSAKTFKTPRNKILFLIDMETTSLSKLISEGCVLFVDDGLVINTKADWVVEGENRVSFTTLIRLVECCREYHWNKDILSKISQTIDSTLKFINMTFYKPIRIGATVTIRYRITNIRQKGYGAMFLVYDQDSNLCARCKLVSIFIDPATILPISPPIIITEALNNLQKSTSYKLLR